MEPRAAIRIEGLSTGYENRRGSVTTVTPPFSAILPSGELTCLLGPNGAGKSTLMRSLAGFIPVISGQVEVEGRPLAGYSPPEMSRTVSVVLTDRVNLEAMTVTELVGLGRAPYTGFWGRMDEHDRHIVARSIELVGISQLASRTVSTLSDGERQKAMIAKALAQETPIIFLDEPTAFLDYPSKVETMQLLRRIVREEGKAVLMSTHDLELAVQLADRLWLLDKKTGMTEGTPEELTRNGAIRNYFSRPGVEIDATGWLAARRVS